MIMVELVEVTPLIEYWLVRRGFDFLMQSLIRLGGGMPMNGLVFASTTIVC
jgi:hypothetical protein